MNESLIHADIFFFVTTIAIIVIALFTAIVGVFVVMYLRHFGQMLKRFQEEFDGAMHDVRHFRHVAREEVDKVHTILDFFIDKLSKITVMPKSKPRKKKVTVESEEA